MVNDLDRKVKIVEVNSKIVSINVKVFLNSVVEKTILKRGSLVNLTENIKGTGLDCYFCTPNIFSVVVVNSGNSVEEVLLVLRRINFDIKNGEVSKQIQKIF